MRLWSLFFVAIAIHLIALSVSADEREKKLIEAARQGDLPAVKQLIANDWTRDNEIAAKKVWPSFRGKAARGIAVGQNLPDQWDAEKGEGVRWKTPIPGLGHSCPDSLGGQSVHHHGRQQRWNREAENRPVRRRRLGERSLTTFVAAVLSRPRHRSHTLAPRGP